jgi:hypothetical protein
MVKSNSSEWKFWNQPYFRYQIYPKQQELLMTIHNCVNDVIVLYASPAAKNFNELFSFYKSRCIIYNSNFQYAFKLNSHNHNTYIASGNTSIAWSEPETIVNVDFSNMDFSFLGEGSNRQSRLHRQSNVEFITDFMEQIEAIYADLLTHEIFHHPQMELLREHKLLYSFAIMHTIKTLFNVQWLLDLGK